VQAVPDLSTYDRDESEPVNEKDVEETYKSASRRSGSADFDFVFRSTGWTGSVVATANTSRVKEIVVASILIHIRSLHGMRPGRVICDVVRGRCGFGSSRVQWGLVNVVPERPEVHVISTAVVEKVAVNRVI